MPRKDGALYVIPPLILEKLAAFDQLEPAVRASFRDVEQMHGEARFPTVPVAQIVRYLHALFLCHCKDALLSVPTTTTRYDHHGALDLLDGWQRGETPPVVAFLEAKLDMQPFLPLARQLDAAETSGHQESARRLRHGMQTLLNRAHNLHAALDSIYGLPRAGLLDEVRGACAQFGHTPDEIRREREWLASTLASYLPHAELGRRNMLVMNSLGVAMTDSLSDRPGERTARVRPGTPPLPPYAENPIPRELAITPPPYSPPPYVLTAAPAPVADEGPEPIGANQP